MKMTVFWDIVPYGLIEIARHFRGAYCLTAMIALMMKAVSTSVMSVNFYETTWRSIPEDSHLHLLKFPICLLLQRKMAHFQDK
jgi:hypothetical protein